MKLWIILPVCVLYLSTGAVVQAQSFSQFSDVLQSNLESQDASTTARSTGPALGTSETLRGSGEVLDPVFEPYDAGKDTLSGTVATGAALLGALVILLVFAIIATSRHREYEE